MQARWGWHGQSDYLEMIELQVDRGARLQMLAMDTTPKSARCTSAETRSGGKVSGGAARQK